MPKHFTENTRGSHETTASFKSQNKKPEGNEITTNMG